MTIPGNQSTRLSGNLRLLSLRARSSTPCADGSDYITPRPAFFRASFIPHNARLGTPLERLRDLPVPPTTVHIRSPDALQLSISRPPQPPKYAKYRSSCTHTKMGAGLHGLSLEPFPLFVDSESSPLPSPKILLNMNGFQLYTPPPKAKRPRISMPAKLSNYLQVRYYQYEVTFGLYMMTLVEKFILNTILVTIVAGILYGLYIGLEPFVVDCVCKIVYYITGSLTSAPMFCFR